MWIVAAASMRQDWKKWCGRRSHQRRTWVMRPTPLIEWGVEPAPDARGHPISMQPAMCAPQVRRLHRPLAHAIGMEFATPARVFDVPIYFLLPALPPLSSRPHLFLPLINRQFNVSVHLLKKQWL